MGRWEPALQALARRTLVCLYGYSIFGIEALTGAGTSSGPLGKFSLSLASWKGNEVMLTQHISLSTIIDTVCARLRGTK